MKRHVVIQDAAPLPEKIVSDTELFPSRFNVYGVYREGKILWNLRAVCLKSPATRIFLSQTRNKLTYCN